MTRFYITVICIQVIFAIFLIHMYETKINELEADSTECTSNLRKAKSPYTIQHSPYCSDSWLLQ